MESLNGIAVSQAIEVLKHTDSNIVSKIPNEFMYFLFKNRDENYFDSIDFNDSNWEGSIRDDAKGILAFAYRKYVASDAEKEELERDDKNELENIYDEFRNNNNKNLDNIFNHNDNIKNDKNDKNDNQLVIIKRETWYRKLWNNILKVLGKKSKR